jgi:hypothetical protein
MESRDNIVNNLIFNFFLLPLERVQCNLEYIGKTEILGKA